MRNPDLLPEVEHALRAGLSFLSETQLPSGELPVYTSLDPTLVTGCQFDSCVFGTTFLVYALQQLRSIGMPVPNEMLTQAQNFILGGMSGPGLFSYYPASTKVYLPPDLDDTCCASAALRNVHPYFFWNQNLDALLASRNSDGVFFTWIEPFAGKNNVDIGVNANVLLYLGDCSETLAASNYLHRVLLEDDPLKYSYYYIDRLFIVYLILRAYSEGARSLKKIVNEVIRLLPDQQISDGSFGGDITTACAVALLGAGPLKSERLISAIKHLLGRQQEDGSWQQHPVYRSADKYFGSSMLTTVISLTALCLFVRKAQTI